MLLALCPSGIEEQNILPVVHKEVQTANFERSLISRNPNPKEDRILFVYVAEVFFPCSVQRIFSANFSCARRDETPRLPFSTPATSFTPLLSVFPPGPRIPSATMERESSSSPQPGPGGRGTGI